MLEHPHAAKCGSHAADARETGARRRHSAGADPAKRGQILDGALRVFMDSGFDSASMNDICRVTGVSKGTLYVYFDDKENLFIALVERERERLFGALQQALDGDLPIGDRLRHYGRQLAAILCSDDVIRAQRIVIGTVTRLPDMARQFYEGGAQRTHDLLEAVFARETLAGRLTVPDPSQAAYQFVELATAGLWRRRLFGNASGAPDDATVAACVDAAVTTFLAAYGPSGQAPIRT